MTHNLPSPFSLTIAQDVVTAAYANTEDARIAFDTLAGDNPDRPVAPAEVPQDTLAGGIEALAKWAESVGEWDERTGDIWLPDPNGPKAAAIIRSLSEANAALEVERDAARRMSDAHREHAQSAVENSASLNRLLSIAESRAETAEASLSAATAEIERLKGALEPFAAKYQDIIPDWDELYHGAKHPDDMGDDELALVTFTVGDLRRARSAIAASKAEAAERGNDLEGGDDE